MTQRISPEVALTIACCRWPRSPERTRAIRDAAASVTDWRKFERHVAWHRVTRLVQDGIADAQVALPADVEARLAARSADCALTALAMARESVRLQRAFEAAGLPALIVKGSPMGVLAYGDPSMKESWDIDLLTSADAVQGAHALLERLGYELYLPGAMTPSQLERFARLTLEAGYRHRQEGFTVELHWRTTLNTRLLPAVTVESASQAIPVAGAQLLTFGDDVLFAYLAVHGTHHAWRRLKWLADLGAFLAARGPADIERMYAAAVGMGAGRAAAVSLLLCRRLLATPIPPLVAAELKRDPMVRVLEAVALHYIGRRRAPRAPGDLPPPLVFLSHFFLARGAGYVVEQFRRMWTRPIERAKFGLASHFLRIPLWLGRAARRTQGRLAQQLAGAVGE